VVFPDPFRPMTPMWSPVAIPIETFARTGFSGKDLEMLSRLKRCM
jgi:hypothetical protein